MGRRIYPAPFFATTRRGDSAGYACRRLAPPKTGVLGTISLREVMLSQAVE
jgi:hypothetical protein